MVVHVPWTVKNEPVNKTSSASLSSTCIRVTEKGKYLATHLLHTLLDRVNIEKAAAEGNSLRNKPFIMYTFTSVNHKTRINS